LTGALGTNGSLTLGVVKVPSFLVLGVVYSPPGAKGYFSMNSTSAVGSSHSTSQSFSNSVQVTEDTSVGVVIANASIEGQWTFTQEATTTQAESITATTSSTDQITGGGDGINHDWDEITIWLNPQINYTQQSPTAVAQSFTPNPDYAKYMNANQGQAFPNSQMDTYPILVGELRNAIWLASQPAGTDRA
jgi:hypothetical protein